MKQPKDTEAAGKIQIELRSKVKIVPIAKRPRFIAGVDAAFFEDTVIGAACIYKYPELVFLEDAHAIKKTDFPYIPGFLSFREGPAVLKAINSLKIKPDIVLFDGQGIAHPRGLGIASHIGVLLNIPSIGCAKSRLIGDYGEPGLKKGSRSPLKYHGRTVGSVLRTRDNTRPLFISPGHMVDLKEAVEIVLRCTSGYRIPEPLRRADRLTKTLKKTGAGSILP
jgi:deoxyribonuclease V